MEARFIRALPAPVQWLLVHSYRAILRGAPPPMHWRDAHIWLSPKVPGSARLDDYRPIALGQLDMKLLTGPLTQRITEVLTRHGVVSDWQQGALPGSNTGPPLFMAQRQLQRGRPNYVFSFDARKAFDTAPHGALHLILRHLSVPPDVIDLLLFLHTCARLRIVTAHGLTQPVYMLRGVRQGNPESPLLYALLLEPLLRAQGHRLRPPGGAEHGLIQAYIDELLVVAHTLQHFVEGVEAVAAYLGMMGMELNPRKCAMATTEGVPGLQLRLCPHLENPWYWVPAADSVPYLGLQLQPDGEFSLQRKHRLRLAAVHHWCLNTLAPPESGAGRHPGDPRRGDAVRRPFHRRRLRTLHATWTTSRSRSRRTGHDTPSTPRGTACRMTGPWGSHGCPRGASRQRWPSWVHSSTTAQPPCARRSPRCSGR